MGKYDVGINLVKRGAALAKASTETPILQTKPAALNSGISSLSLKSLESDIASFSSDYSLRPEFLDSLLDIKGTTLERTVQIKDKMLLAMGYKHPELVKVEFCKSGSDSGFCAAIDYSACSLQIYDSISQKKLICTVRHELDHIDKIAKLIKTKGLNEVQRLFSFDRLDVWKKLSEDADIKNFDVDKYWKALIEYKEPANSKSIYKKYLEIHLYCTNPLEESAYKIEKQIKEHFNISTPTTYEVFGERFGKIKELLNKLSKNKSQTIQKDFREEAAFNELYITKRILMKKNGLDILKDNNKEEAIKICLAPVKPADYFKIFDDIYKWLSTGKFKITDIVNL